MDASYCYPLEKTSGGHSKKRKVQCCLLTHALLILSGISEVSSVTSFKALEKAVSFIVNFLGKPCTSMHRLMRQSGTTHCSLMGERLSGGRSLATSLSAYLPALLVSNTSHTQQSERERNESVWL